MKRNFEHLLETGDYKINRNLSYILGPGGLEKSTNFYEVTVKVPAEVVNDATDSAAWLMAEYVKPKPVIALNDTEATYLKCLDTALPLEATFMDLLDSDLMAKRLWGVGWFEGVPTDATLGDIMEALR